jgi:hypothetical protein
MPDKRGNIKNLKILQVCEIERGMEAKDGYSGQQLRVNDSSDVAVQLGPRDLQGHLNAQLRQIINVSCLGYNISQLSRSV